jgi:hypothetical protein
VSRSRVFDMSINGLAVETPPPAVAGGAALAALRERVNLALDALTELDLDAIGAREQLDLVRWLTSAESHLASVRLGAVAAVDRLGAARKVGALSTAAWLRSEGAGAAAARRDVDLAEALGEPDHDQTRRGLARGRFTPEHAIVITQAKDRLSDQVHPTARAAFEADLLDLAETLDPFELRNAAKRAAAKVDPAGSGDLARAERSAKARRELVIFKGRDGMHVLRGQLDTEGAATLAAALDPLSAPRASSLDGPDPRTAARRLADALIDLAHHGLSNGKLPHTGGLPPQVVVTMTLDQLRGTDRSCAELVGGPIREPITAAAARRIACDAGIIPAVLGAGSEILDYGTLRRTASPGQRRALALRDGGCTAPGCDRPPSWSEAHHLVPWAASPRTDLANLALVCDAHHDLLHHDNWSIHLVPDGKAIWTAPPQPPAPEPHPPELAEPPDPPPW